VAAVSYDPVATLADFARRRGITFPLLSDAGSAVIRKYGILNTSVAENQPTFGIPYPGTFILDHDGVVRSRHFETAYQERDTIASVLVKLGARLDVEGTRVTAPHLTATTWVTDRIAAPGTHFSVVVDVVPGPRIHVYAAGVTGYKPVAMHIASQPSLLVRQTQFPPAEDYFFKPLNEHVAVYQKPFRIVQDLELDPAPISAAALAERKSLQMTGTLEYQACDDKVCFNPQSLSLSWTIGLKPLDRERVTK
jgi:hypothetical protein